jgi:hypothetical protein
VTINEDFAYKKTLTKATDFRDNGKYLFKSNTNGKIYLMQFK